MTSRPKCVACGNEEDEEALRLARHWYKYRPNWILLGEHEPIRCYECWKKYFAGYLSAGFSLEDSGVWSDVFGSRVDVAVSWRNAGFKDENITIWTKDFEEPHLAASWRDQGFSPREAQRWSEVCSRAEDAATWRKEGFSSDLDPDWITWGVTIDEVKACIAKEDRNRSWPSEMVALDIEYKTEYGLTFQEAVFCLTNYLFTNTLTRWNWYPSANQLLEYWKPIGLPITEIVELCRQIDSDESEELFHIHDELRFKIKNWKPDIWVFLPKFCEELQKAGVPITYENLVKYWGLSGPQILKAIDSGTEVKLASKIVRSGIPASKAKTVELLIAKGIDQDSALLLTKRGFSVRTVNEIENWGYSIQRLVSLAEEAKTLGATEIKQWLLCGSEEGYRRRWDRQISVWHQYGFKPAEAYQWFLDGFQPSEAYAWSKSGAKTPTVAKRRKEAGITPKTN